MSNLSPASPTRSLSSAPDERSSVALSPIPHASSLGPASVNGYADRLMDELFQDVEGLLGGELVFQRSAEAIAAPEPSPSDLSPAAPPAEIEPFDPLEDSLDDIILPGSDEAWDELEPEAPRRTWLDSLMVAVTGVSLVVLTVAGVALYYNSRAIAPGTTTDLSLAGGESQGNQEFSEYMQRSLEAIQRRNQAQPADPSNDLPSVAVASNPPTAAQQAGTVLERVYVPVYQPSQGAPANQPTNAQPTTPPRLAAAPSTPTAPAVAHTLVGVLELGDRSAALFEINGETQRVYVGESIGASGWTLVSVANQEAIVRRNGDVRSIYIGQQF